MGHSIKSGIAWQIVYLLATLGGIYILVSGYYGRLLGALGAAVYLGFPIVLGLDRMVYIENLLALEVVLVVILAMTMRAFERPILSALLGFVIGFGQMTKWQFSFYVLPLLAIVWIRCIRDKRSSPDAGRELGCRLRNPLITAAVALLVSAPWYLLHFSKILDDVMFHAFVKEMGDPSVLSAKSLLYYLQAFPGEMLGIPISGLILWAVLSALWRGRIEPHRFAWCLGFLVSLLLLSGSKHKEGRFLIPLLPFVVALLMAAIGGSQRWLRVTSVLFLLLISVVNAATQTVWLGPMYSRITLPIGLGRKGFIIRSGMIEWLLMPVDQSDWALESIFREIRLVSAREGLQPRVHWCLKDDHPFYNPTTLRSIAYTMYITEADTHEQASFCLVWRDPLPSGTVDTAHADFMAVDTWALPDGTEAILYRKKPEIVDMVPH